MPPMYARPARGTGADLLRIRLLRQQERVKRLPEALPLQPFPDGGYLLTGTLPLALP
ncbi:hypothetical protein D3C74_408340 [compost metagenome]